MLRLSAFNCLVIASCLIGMSFPAFAQESSDGKAFVVFHAELDDIVKSKAMSAMGKDSFYQILAMDDKAKEVARNATRFSAYFAAPEGIDPESLSSTKFLVVIRMKNEPSAIEMEKDLRSGFVDDVIDGKKVLRAEGRGAPPIFAIRDGNAMRIGSRNFLLADEDQLIDKKLKPMLKEAEKKHMRVAANFDGARAFFDAVADAASENADFMSRQYIGLLKQTSTIEVSLDFDAATLFSAKVAGHDDDENKNIKLKMDAAIGLAKGFVDIGLADLGEDSPESVALFKAFTKGIEVASADKSTLITIKRPENYEKLLTTAFKDLGQQQNRARTKSRDVNQMKQVALSKHNFADTHREFPFTEERTKNLSWRVQVLQFLEEDVLYKQFDLEEKWSSKRNGKLVSKMPKLFRLSNGSTISFIKPDKIPKYFDEITDGTSNTIVFVENREAKMIPWTKPEGVTPKEFVAMVKDLDDGDELIVAFYDGSVRAITNQASKDTILNLCHPSDGRIIDWKGIK